MNYETKYFKYKQKYLDLKQSIMMGGAFPFKNGRSFFVMAKLGGSEGTRGNETFGRVVARRDSLGLKDHNDDLHMTFLQLMFNVDIELSIKICENKVLHVEILKLFKHHIRDNDIEFRSLHESGKMGRWEIFGTNGTEYFARVYSVTNPRKLKFIQDFRDGVIKCIGDLVGGLSLHRPDGSPFIFFKMLDGRSLFAINYEHYGDVETWKPHISVFNRREIKDIADGNETAKEVDKIFETITPDNRDEVANKIISKIGKVRAISEVSVNRDPRANHFHQIRISHQGLGGARAQDDYPMVRW
jgi:hypothetical protein